MTLWFRTRRSPTLRRGLVLLLVWHTMSWHAAPPARAWGPAGHVIVAWIADQYLLEATRRKVGKLLREEKLYDRDVANWADEIREGGELDRVYPRNHRWHFVDIPFDADRYDPRRDCRNQECVIAQIERFRKTIANQRLPKDERYDALKFLIHFVADLHQPLHSVEWNRDNGGSLRQVVFLGQRGQSNLHRVWDSQILNRRLGDDDAEDFARQLMIEITPEQRAQWEQGSVVDWALEAHDVGVKHCYRGFSEQFDDQRPVQITQEYVRSNGPIVEQQLARAGVRLAKVLNDALRVTEGAAQVGQGSP